MSTGKADPSVLNQFNDIMKDAEMNGSNDVNTNIPNVAEILDSDLIDEVKAKDGTLPGT